MRRIVWRRGHVLLEFSYVIVAISSFDTHSRSRLFKCSKAGREQSYREDERGINSMIVIATSEVLIYNECTLVGIESFTSYGLVAVWSASPAVMHIVDGRSGLQFVKAFPVAAIW
jgi:hypothetical protein